MSSMTVEEIQNIGVDVQQSISDQMSELLRNTKCLDIGKAGNSLAELSSTSNKLTKKITRSLSGNNAIVRVFTSPKRWLARFDSIEKSIDSITVTVDAESERLDNLLVGLATSLDIMKANLASLNESKGTLNGIIAECRDDPELDPDGFKTQAAISRLKVLTTTSALTQQEITKAILVIQENREVSNQLKEASSNLVPMFKTMMMNVIASKANEEAVNLRKNLISVANNMVIDSAKSIANTADNLIVGRQEALISPETLDQANQIIQNAVKRVLDSAQTESEVNLQVIQSLEASASQVGMLYKLGSKMKEDVNG